MEDQVKAAETNRSGLEAANTKLREKGDKAKELIGKIFNVDFLLTLSGLTDIYEKFGAIVQVTQMVHLLPHERLDAYNKAVKDLNNMAKCLDHSNCSQFLKSEEKTKCLWPIHHADKASHKETGTIRDMPVVNKHGVRAAGLQVRTRRQEAERLVKARENPQEKLTRDC